LAREMADDMGVEAAQRQKGEAAGESAPVDTADEAAGGGAAADQEGACLNTTKNPGGGDEAVQGVQAWQVESADEEDTDSEVSSTGSSSDDGDNDGGGGVARAEALKLKVRLFGPVGGVIDVEHTGPI
jgi:hypothetical protein